MICVLLPNLLVKEQKTIFYFFRLSLFRLGIELDLNEALSLIRTAIREQTDDHTHETELTSDQYLTLMLRYVGSSELNDELRQTFDALDRNHDGRITREDFDKLRNESSFFNHLDDEQYELIVKELSNVANNNKGIDFNQFVNLMMNQ
jgi:Ca2+-binding EF-hand superfamily protein